MRRLLVGRDAKKERSLSRLLLMKKKTIWIMVTKSHGNRDTEKAVLDPLFLNPFSTLIEIRADNHLFLTLVVKVVFSAQIQKTNRTHLTAPPDKVFMKQNLKSILQTKNKR
jgi:hypothetical protein